MSLKREDAWIVWKQGKLSTKEEKKKKAWYSMETFYWPQLHKSVWTLQEPVYSNQGAVYCFNVNIPT